MRLLLKFIMTITTLNLVGLIYQGINETPPWQNFAEGLRTALQASHVAITLHYAEDEDEYGDIYVMASEPENSVDWALAESIYRADLMKKDPNRLDRMQPGEIAVIDPATADEEWGRFLSSLDIAKGLRACFAEPAGLHCWIDIVRGHQHPSPEFSIEELGLIQKLRSHLEQALGLYGQLRQRDLENTVYESVASHFAVGCVFLDSNRHVVHANQKARSIIRQSGTISLKQDRFSLVEAESQRDFKTAFDAIITARPEDYALEKGQILRLRRRDRGMLALMIYPAPLQHYYRGNRTPRAVVYLLDLAEPHRVLNPSQTTSVARIRQLLGLTRQEATLSLLLGYGLAISEAALEMGIAESTARNYSKRIYAKLGISNQTDLVRLILRTLPLLQ